MIVQCKLISSFQIVLVTLHVPYNPLVWYLYPIIVCIQKQFVAPPVTKWPTTKHYLRSSSYHKYMFVWWGFTSLSTPYWVISWRSVLLAEEIGVGGGNRRSAAGNWQTLSHMTWKSNLNFANARPRLELTPRGDRLVINTGKLWRTTIRSRPPRPQLISV